MRKKTIKYYFFNKYIPNLSINSLLFFSKRSFRNNRQIIKYKKKSNRLAARRFAKKLFYDYLKKKIIYKNLIRYKILLNQLKINRRKLKFYFIKSFFFSYRWFHKSIKYDQNIFTQLLLWFFIKHNISRFTTKFTRKYPKLGSISSQNVHILSRKNLSYQTLFKYRSKLLNMNIYTEYFYNNINYQNIYNNILLFLINSFSYDPRAQNIYYDEHFNIIFNDNIININIKHNLYKNFSPWNNTKIIGPVYNYCTNNDLILLWENSSLIELFLTESDITKKGEIKNFLESKININFSIFLSRFFACNESDYINDMSWSQPIIFIKNYNFIFNY